MAGHSKWANIKHRKGAQDAKRGKIFQKLSKEIMVAAQKGADLDSNPSLRLAVSKARLASMPKTNIERAIAKGSGTAKDAKQFQEIFYGATVSKGVQLVIVCLTDNFNRLASNLKSYLNRAGGNLGKQNVVPFVFQQKGVIDIDKNLFSEEEMMNISLEIEVENLEIEKDFYHLTFAATQFLSILEKLKKLTKRETFLQAEVSYLASSEVELNEEDSAKVLAFIDKLEDDDDIQAVYHNLALR